MRRDHEGTNRRTAGLLGPVLLGAGILLFFLLRYPARGFGLPMGPDAPVYLWWARLASIDGLSIANWRPGIPALTLIIGQTLHLSQVQVLAAIGGVLAATTALAAAALVDAARPAGSFQSRRALLAGVLAGTFAVNLAGGYFGNLVFAALFIAAAAVIAGTRNKAGVAAAAALVAGGGLAHPMFFLAGTAILLITAFVLRREEPGQARRTAFAAGGGVAVVGAGMLSLLAGPRPLGVDTSADAFLRRAGLAQSLAAQYRSRLSHHWARYELWLIVPLAFLGRKASSSGFVRRFLQVWVGVTVLGLVAALVTDQIPGLRTLSFAFALPILAALGLSRAWGRFRPLAAWALVAALAAVLIFGSALTWFRERPYITDEQVAQMDQANSFIDATPLGTPLVFVVNENNPDLVSFHVTDWGNVIRASVPPDRIREVYLYVGTPQNAAALKPTLTGNSEHDTLSKLYLKDLLAGTRGKPAPLICFVPAFQSEAPSLPLPSQITCRANMATIISTPSEPWAIVLAGFEVFALLAFAGLGWSLAVLHGRFRVVALSPAFGAAAISLVAIAVDRLGFRLGNSATTTSVTAIAALSGYLAAWLRYRSGRRSDILAEQAGAGTQPPPEID